jgi:hypothetical protein
MRKQNYFEFNKTEINTMGKKHSAKGCDCVLEQCDGYCRHFLTRLKSGAVTVVTQTTGNGEAEEWVDGGAIISNTVPSCEHQNGYLAEKFAGHCWVLSGDPAKVGLAVYRGADKDSIGWQYDDKHERIRCPLEMFWKLDRKWQW